VQKKIECRIKPNIQIPDNRKGPEKKTNDNKSRHYQHQHNRRTKQNNTSQSLNMQNITEGIVAARVPSNGTKF